MIRKAIMVILTSVSPLLADSMEQKAKDAKTLLNAFQLDEAFNTYSSILDELSEEQLSSEFAYWIYRERGFAAYLLDDHATTLSDIMHMKSIISSFGYPEEAMNEYYYALMEIANREASYTKCIVHGSIPELSYKPYDPEKDAPWYNSYCIFDVNSQKIEFELRFERNY